MIWDKSFDAVVHGDCSWNWSLFPKRSTKVNQRQEKSIKTWKAFSQFILYHIVIDFVLTYSFWQNLSKHSQGVYFVWDLTFFDSIGLKRHQKGHENLERPTNVSKVILEARKPKYKNLMIWGEESKDKLKLSQITKGGNLAKIDNSEAGGSFLKLNQIIPASKSRGTVF